MSGRLALLRRLRGPAFARGLELRACSVGSRAAALTDAGASESHGHAPALARCYVSKSSTSPAAQAMPEERLPVTRIDEFGATSVVEEADANFKPTKFENVDGRRIEDGRYAAFTQEISGEAGSRSPVC